ncbi:MAG: hypothetical protein U1F43_19175 [Myxococcota bacterium]
MNPITLAKAFRDGLVRGPRGVVRAQAALMTRRSLLVFTPQTVLKLRIPDLIDGADQTLRSVRLAMTERERFVGRRLSPHAYLDDVGLRLGDDGELLLVHEELDGEPIVATWRQPLERRADQLLAAGELTAESFRKAMQALALFHETAPEPTLADRRDYPVRAADRWRSTLERLAAEVDRLPDAEAAAVLSADERARLGDETAGWLADLDKELSHRVLERRVRDGHGDLALDHIFLVDPPVFIDPADDRAVSDQMIDTAEDVMRLAMELDLAAGAELSDAVVAMYAAYAIDPRLGQVAALYKRLAAVRVAAEVLADPTLDERPERARAYVELALGYALGGR